MFWLFLLLSCDQAERAALDDARADAAAHLVGAPTGWKADARLSFPLPELEALSRALLDDALTRAPAVQAPIAGVTLGISLKPQLHVDELHLAPNPERPECLRAQGVLSGTLGAQVGGRALGVPATIHLTTALCLVIVEQRALKVRLSDVTGVTLEVAGWRSDHARRREKVAEFLSERLEERPPQARVAVIGEEGLPVLATRLSADLDMVWIDLRTNVAMDTPPLPPAEVHVGAAVTMSDRSFTALLRRQIWARAGSKPTPLLDPVEVDLGSDRFSANVRFWNPGLPVWWEDFRVSGPITLEGDHVRVDVRDVEARGGSGWFGASRILADPVRRGLAAALEGRLATTLPGELAREVKGVQLGAQLRALRDVPDGFILEADISTDADPPYDDPPYDDPPHDDPPPGDGAAGSDLHPARPDR